MENSNFFQEDKAKIVSNNISYLMSMSNITSPRELAKLINVPATTLYTYLKSPLSNSSAKSALCKYFGITVFQLENELLSEREFAKNKSGDFEKKSSENFSSDKPLMSMRNDEMFELIKTSECDDDFAYKDKIKKLKESISKKMNFEFNHYLSKAQDAFENGNIEEAYSNMSSAWWNIHKDDLEIITPKIIEFYIDLCQMKEKKEGLEKLISILTNDEFFNANIVLFLASTLESIYPDLALECYDCVNAK